ncbi:MAG: CopD family protein [Myxococcota bacterium]|nr:CopD family protein [Deltaproteobacteria bacterium]MDQ3341112.1 CopD family protein [Myxococcota bacterium]
MNDKLLAWLLSGHLIGVFLWIGGLFAVYWLLRIHAHSPKEMHEKLTLMERSLALMMDIAAALAIGCGLALALGQEPNIFARPKSGWFHIKLTVVVLGILPVHGMIRARIKKFGMGQITPVPQWMWTLLLASITAIAILIFVVKLAMLRS